MAASGEQAGQFAADQAGGAGHQNAQRAAQGAC
jgi:hypothetical protein